MNRMIRRLGACAIAAVVQAGLAGLALAQSPAQPSLGGQAPQYGAPEAQGVNPETASEATPATELPVLYVTGVEILRTTTEPRLDIIRVTGLTGSQGWSDPELVPTFAGKPLDDILDLQFIATMPVQSQKAEGFVPIAAVFPLQPGHPFKGVRVRASENAVEVNQIPGHNEVTINVDSCKDCVGKKFAERGQAQPGQPGVVRQEDLPKVLRWIIPSRGIRGITHSPNRLNLILDNNNTIVQAFWE